MSRVEWAALIQHFILLRIFIFGPSPQDEGAELPFTPPMRGELYAVRSGVRPKLQRSAIEVGVIFLFFFHLTQLKENYLLLISVSRF